MKPAKLELAREQIKEYAYTIGDDGRIYKVPNEDPTPVKLSFKDGRFYAYADRETGPIKLWSGPNVAYFLRAYWYAVPRVAP
jgi:hypothetical protein